MPTLHFSSQRYHRTTGVLSLFSLFSLSMMDSESYQAYIGGWAIPPTVESRKATERLG